MGVFRPSPSSLWLRCCLAPPDITPTNRRCAAPSVAAVRWLGGVRPETKREFPERLAKARLRPCTVYRLLSLVLPRRTSPRPTSVAQRRALQPFAGWAVFGRRQSGIFEGTFFLCTFELIHFTPLVQRAAYRSSCLLAVGQRS